MSNMIVETMAKPLNITTSVILNDDIPSAADFYADLNFLIIIAISVATALFLIILIMFLLQIFQLLQITSSKFIASTLTLNVIYPVVGAAALVSIIIPKSVVICDTICHLSFTFVAYQFFWLCLEYVSGETKFIKSAADINVFNLRTPPCCCWMFFIKPSSITKKKITILRLMILQMPIIQTTLLISLNIIYMEDSGFYFSVLFYFIPFIVVSILSGVWALQVTARMIAPFIKELKIIQKYFAMQLVLIICKLQPPIVQVIMSQINIKTDYPVTSKVISNTIVQLIILLEIIALSLWAQRLYKIPTRRS